MHGLVLLGTVYVKMVVNVSRMSANMLPVAALLLLHILTSSAQQDLTLTSSSGAKIIVEGSQPRLKVFPIAGSTSEYLLEN